MRSMNSTKLQEKVVFYDNAYYVFGIFALLTPTVSSNTLLIVKAGFNYFAVNTIPVFSVTLTDVRPF